MDKRVLNRAEIPGAKVQFRKMKYLNVFPLFSRVMQVNNLSKSGISFTSEEALSYGDSIIMKISFPGGKNLKLKGKIRWYKETDSINSFNIGVQLLPFGLQSKYNHPKSLVFLRSMSGQELPEPKPNGNE